MTIMGWGGGYNVAVVPNQSQYSLYPTGSVSLWIRVWWLDIWHNWYVISKGGEWALRGINGFNGGNAPANLQLETGIGGTLTTLAGTANIWDNTGNPFTHVVATWDIPNQLNLYVNGVLDTTKNSGILAYSPSTYPVWILGNSYISDGYWNGAVDDVRIYNRVLSAAEVSSMWASQGGDGIINGIQSRWILEGNGMMTSEVDAGPLRNTATSPTPNLPAYIQSISNERKRHL